MLRFAAIWIAGSLALGAGCRKQTAAPVQTAPHTHEAGREKVSWTVTWADKGAAANRRRAGQSNGSREFVSDCCSRRSSPAAVAELGRQAAPHAMAQVLFFMDRTDTRSFVTFLIEQFAAEFALDQCPTPQPPVFRSLDEVDSAVARDPFSPRFFVTSSLWQKFPLSSTEIHTNDGRHFFSIWPFPALPSLASEDRAKRQAVRRSSYCRPTAHPPTSAAVRIPAGAH